MPTFRDDTKIGTKVPLIKTADLNDKSVTEKKLADGSITKEKIATGAVTSEKLQHNAVITETINDGAVTSEKIAEGAVTMDGIEDSAVVESKINNKAVTNVKIDDAAVDTRTIEDKSVTNAKIADGSITQEKIFNSSVTTEKIVNESVSAEKLQSGLRSTIVSTHDKTIELDKKKANVTDVDYALECLENKIGDRVVVEGNVTNLPDDEDLTSVQVGGREIMKLNDRAYEPSNFSGKGYKILRKNIQRLNLPTVTILVSNIPSSSGDITITINGKTTTIALDVATDTTTAIIATKIGTALKSSLDDYDVSVSSNTIVLTRNNSKYASPSSIDVGNTTAGISVKDSITKSERKNVLTQDMVNEPNTVYEIRYSYDLINSTITIPENCVLKFNGGFLSNGEIVGDNTLIYAKEVRCFSLDSTLTGTWSNLSAYSIWFSIINDCVLDNTKEYVSGTNNGRGFKNLFLFNEIHLAPGTYYVENALHCISGQHIYGNNAIIKYNNLNKYVSFLNIGVNNYTQNVTIENLTIIGFREKGTNEFNHGIDISKAENVRIINVTLLNNLGDGISMGLLKASTNGINYPVQVEVAFCNCENNYRQGMSIINGTSIYVHDSVFSNTNGTAPQAGIDIEPEISEGDDFAVVSQVKIANCRFFNNKGAAVQLYSQYSTTKNSEIKQIEINGNVFIKNSIYVTKANNVSLCNNILDKDSYILLNEYYNDINIVNNTISNVNIGIFITPNNKNISDERVRVSNNYIFNTYKYGIQINNDNLKYLILEYNKINYCAHGISVEGCSYTTYINNIVLNKGINKDGVKYDGFHWIFLKKDDKTTRTDLALSTTNVTEGSRIIGDFKFDNKPQWWNGVKWVYSDGIDTSILSIGATEKRPTEISIGFQYFDTTLKRYIVWNGTEWTNMDGTAL